MVNCTKIIRLTKLTKADISKDNNYLYIPLYLFSAKYKILLNIIESLIHTFKSTNFAHTNKLLSGDTSRYIGMMEDH